MQIITLWVPCEGWSEFYVNPDDVWYTKQTVNYKSPKIMKKTRLKQKFCTICGAENPSGRLMTCSSECGKIEIARRESGRVRFDRKEFRESFVMQAF
jgi:hypothetical protein